MSRILKSLASASTAPWQDPKATNPATKAPIPINAQADSRQNADVSLEAVVEQVSSVLIGKPQQVKLAVACMLARGHLLIEDVPGVGKTTLAQAMGSTLGLPWKRIQFTSDLLPADIVGVSIFNTTTQSFEFKPGPVFTSVLLADEINRAPPKAQSAQLQAMEERTVSVDGVNHPLSDAFFVIATQNSADQLGAYPLPESQLDRFLVGIELGYPDQASERELLRSGDKRAGLTELAAIADENAMQGWINAAAQLPVSDTLLDYAQALLAETRAGIDHDSPGLSPRAGLSLLALARAWALLHGNQQVLPEDVQAVFPAVAGHRLTGSVKKGKAVCAAILDRVPVR